jgi:hypothetical protein
MIEEVFNSTEELRHLGELARKRRASRIVGISERDACVSQEYEQPKINSQKSTQ